jgi:hypothetical protein
MKTALILMLSSAGLLLAQDSKVKSQTADDAPLQTAQPQAVVVKRLASVTWDPDAHKLTWMVERGAEIDGQFVAASTQRYEISPEEALMASKDESREMAPQEASSVGDLLNLLSLYCAQSTDRWERASSEDDEEAAQSRQAADQTPATQNPDSTPKASGQNNQQPNDKPTKIDQPDQKSTLPATLIAANTGVATRTGLGK